MDSTDNPATPPAWPPAIAAALVAAQAEAESIGRDGHNKQIRYNYATSDAIAAAARACLTAHGLAFVRLHVSPLSRGLETADIGNMAYVGDVAITYALVHTSGAAMTWASVCPVIAQRGRPHDKAIAAAVTYYTGQIQLGLLCLDRESRDSIDQRPEDIDELADHHPPPKPRPAVRDPYHGQPYCTAEQKATIDRACVTIAKLGDVKPVAVWTECLRRLSILDVFTDEAGITRAMEPRLLRGQQVELVIRWLEAELGRARALTEAPAPAPAIVVERDELPHDDDVDQTPDPQPYD